MTPMTEAEFLAELDLLALAYVVDVVRERPTRTEES